MDIKILALQFSELEYFPLQKTQYKGDDNVFEDIYHTRTCKEPQVYNFYALEVTHLPPYSKNLCFVGFFNL